MYELINNVPIKIKEYKGHRVVTFRDIDTVHGRPEGTARKRFHDNRERFIEGEDFFKITPSEFRTAFGDMDKRQQNDITLITESGYLMIVKSLTDDLSWRVQRELVKTYFRVKETEVLMEKNIADIKLIINEAVQDTVDTLAPCFYLLYTKNDILEKKVDNLEKMVRNLEKRTKSVPYKNKIRSQLPENPELVSEFINECCECRCGSCNDVSTADLYRVFNKWCLQKNVCTVRKSIFINQICRYFHTNDKKDIRKYISGKWYYLITLTPTAIKKFSF